MFVIFEKGMLDDGGKGHSLFTIKDKDSLEEIFQIGSDFFEFLFFLNSVGEVEKWSASSFNLGLHIMSLERVLGKEHEIEEDAKRPDINGDAIVGIADDFRRHVFLSAAMSFGPDASDGPGKAKIGNLVAHLSPFPVLFLRQQHILTLDIPMNKAPLMNALQTLHNLHHDFERMVETESLSGQFCLVGQKISLLTIFQYDDDKVRR